MNKKLKRFGLLGLICCLATAGGALTVMANADSAETTKTISQVSLNMIDGASVRYKTGAETDYAQTGIRFQYAMSGEDYAALMNNVGEGDAYQSVTFGMLLSPADIEANAPFNYENVFGANAVYNWAVWNNGIWSYTAEEGKTRISNVVANELTLAEDGTYVMSGSVVNLKDANIAREFIGVGYVKVVDWEGEASYKFASFTDKDVTNNIRSMAHVAQSAIVDEDVEDDTKTLLGGHYVDKVKDVATTYTIAHYVPNADQTYGAPFATTTVESTINATATAAGASQDGYRLVSYDEDTVVFANGKTTVNAYYAYKPTNLMEYRIVIAEDATEYEQYAAEEFQFFYQEATGITLPIVKSDKADGYCISIGDTALWAANPNAKLDDNNDSGYVIKTVNDNILINGTTETSKLFGVYGFMEKVFGLKMYTAKAWSFDSTKTSITSIEALDVDQNPSINKGYITGQMSRDWKDFARMQMFPSGDNEVSDKFNSHSYFYLVDPDKYFYANDEYEQHPEWFYAEENEEGELVAKTLCLYEVNTDAELYNLIIEGFKAQIIAEPTDKYFNFGYEDYSPWHCGCPKCTAIYPYTGGASGANYQGGPTGYLIYTVNKFATTIHEWLLNPNTGDAALDASLQARADEVKIGMFSYMDGCYPPKAENMSNATCPVEKQQIKFTFADVTLNDYAFVYWAPIGIQGADEFTSTSTNGMNKQLYNHGLEAWKNNVSEGTEILIWGYTSQFNTYMVPYDNIETAQSVISAFETLNPELVWFQGPSSGQNETMSFGALRNYVYANLMRDSSRTVESLKAEFFAGYYGDLADEMIAYYNNINAKLDELDAAGYTTTGVHVDYDTATDGYQTMASEYGWTYEELLGWYNEVKYMLDLCGDNEELYNRILPELIFPQYMLLENFMEPWYEEELYETDILLEVENFLATAEQCQVRFYKQSGNAKDALTTKAQEWLTRDLGEGSVIDFVADAMEQAGGVSNEINYAESKYIPYWSIYSTKEGDTNEYYLFYDQAQKAVRVPSQSTVWVSLNSMVLEKAVEAGYTHATITISIYSTQDTWIDGKNWTPDRKGGTFSFTYALADMLVDGVYEFKFNVGGGWQGIDWYLDSFYFGNIIAEGLADSETNWATMEYVSLWPSATANYTAGDPGLVLKGKTGATWPLVINPDLLAAAVEAGHTHVNFSFYAANFHLWPSISNGTDTSVWFPNKNGYQTRYDLSFELSQFDPEGDGTYTMQLKGANWNTAATLYIYNLSFNNPAIDVSSELVAQAVAQPNVNLANSTYAGLFIINATNNSSASAIRADASAPDHAYIMLKPQVVAAAIEAGYTHATVTMKNSSSSHTYFYNGDDRTGSGVNSLQGNGGNGTIELALADYPNGITAYAGGSWGSHYVSMTDLQFYNKLDKTISTNIAEDVNWAEVEYAALWTPTVDGALVNDGTNVQLKNVGSTPKLIVNPALLAAAVAQGYTHLTITATATSNFNNWFRVENATGTVKQATSSQAKPNVPITFELELASFANGDGTYTMYIGTGGWDPNHVMTINTLSFMLPPTEATVTFDSNGGSAVDAKVVNIGDAVEEPTAPTKVGYTFQGWTLKGKAYEFSTAVNEDITLVASWTADIYNITYVLNGGSAENPATYTVETETITLNAATKAGMEFVGWYAGNAKVTTIAQGTMGDIELVAVFKYATVEAAIAAGDFATTNWAEAENLAVWSADKGTFETSVNNVIWTKGSASGTILVTIAPELLSAAAAAGYGKMSVTFTAGWLAWPSITNAEGTALWSAGNDGQNRTLTATVNLNSFNVDGVYTLNIKGVNGSDSNTWNFTSLTFIKTYTATFDSNGGSDVASQTVEAGGVFTKPTAPTKDGYTFINWLKDGEVYDFATVVEGNITLTANWAYATVEDIIASGVDYTTNFAEVEYVAVFGGEGIAYDKSTNIVMGSKSASTGVFMLNHEFLAVMAEAGYTKFTWNFSIGAIEAWPKVFSPNDATVTLWEPGWNDRTGKNKTFNATFNIADLLSTTTSEYEFKMTLANWNSATTGVVYLTMNSLTFSKEFTVAFDSNGGSAVDVQIVEEGATANEPTAPTKAMYNFVGWFNGEDEFSFDTVVTENITLTAAWEFKYEDAIADTNTNWASNAYIDAYTSTASLNNSWAAGIRADASDHNPSITLSAEIVARAIAAGYTHAEIVTGGSSISWTIYCNGSDTTELFSKNATSTENTIALADYVDGITIKSAGGWGSRYISITKIVFSNPVDRAIDAGIEDMNTNWAAVENAAVWAPTADGALVNDGTNVQLKNVGSTPELIVNPALLAAAAAQGYTKVTITATATSNFNNWFRVENATGTVKQATSEQAKPNVAITFDLALASFANGDGTYTMIIGTGGWDPNHVMTINTLTFYDPVLQVVANGIGDASTNYALEEYSVCFSGDVAYVDGALAVANSSSAAKTLTVSSTLLSEAVRAGYTTVTFVVTATNVNAWAKYTANGVNTQIQTSSNKNIVEKAFTVNLADCLAEDGTYSLTISQNRAWSTSYVNIHSFTFA